MQEGKWRLGRIERLHRQMQHDGRILADRIEHHRIGESRRDLTKNMDCFGFKTLEMRQVLGHENYYPLSMPDIGRNKIPSDSCGVWYGAITARNIVERP